jgi:hypothetical protein
MTIYGNHVAYAGTINRCNGVSIVQLIRVLGYHEPQFLVIEGIYLKYYKAMSKKKGKKLSPRKWGGEEISLFIKNWRINESLTMSDFGKLAGVHTNSVYNLEHQKNVTVSTLLRCISATGLTLSEFFEGME